ncbi:MAG: DUF6266 family protein [Bacteroidota bacterium]
MARIKQGFLGNASGKLGNVVFARWRRLETARQYQPDIHDANSPGQQKQRNRMVALLEFLKPINKSFIRQYNSPYTKESTPWAKAIRDNMSGVSPEGCFPLQNLKLGVPRYPAPIIENVIYNPFIDQVHFKYQPSGILPHSESLPYHVTSVLGKYATPDGQHEFDVRHLLCMLPDDEFWCSTYDGYEEIVYTNFWHHGVLFFIYYDTYNEKVYQNPFENISSPAYFQPRSLLEGFNTNVKVNLVPSKSITWQYKHEANIWYLDFNINFLKTQLTTPANYTLIFWAVGLVNNAVYPSGPYEWDLQESTYEITLGEHGMPGSAILLYSIFDKKGVQVSRFNRIYIDKGSDENTYPYFDQLFLCNYSHPASFVLSGNQCGFSGNIDELFSDFIELWNQGVIHDPSEPEPVTEFGLRITPHADGDLHTADYKRVEDSTYFFDIDQDALLVPVPKPGFAFSAFAGTDAADVVPVSADVHSIKMSKARELSAVFVPQP